MNDIRKHIKLLEASSTPDIELDEGWNELVGRKGDRLKSFADPDRYIGSDFFEVFNGNVGNESVSVQAPYNASLRLKIDSSGIDAILKATGSDKDQIELLNSMPWNVTKENFERGLTAARNNPGKKIVLFFKRKPVSPTIYYLFSSYKPSGTYNFRWVMGLTYTHSGFELSLEAFEAPVAFSRDEALKIKAVFDLHTLKNLKTDVETPEGFTGFSKQYKSRDNRKESEDNGFRHAFPKGVLTIATNANSLLFKVVTENGETIEYSMDKNEFIEWQHGISTKQEIGRAHV